MSNLCDYSMLIHGSKEGIEEFLKTLNAKYNYKKKEFSHDRHLCRILDTTEDSAGFIQIDEDNNIYQLCINGYCDWSVWGCMFKGYDKYTTCYSTSIDKRQSSHSRATSVVNEARRLNLFIEVFAEETACDVSEHFLVSPNGVLIADYDCDDEWDFEAIDQNWFAKYNPSPTNYRARRRRQKRKLKKRMRGK